MEKLLKILDANARMETEKIAVMLDMTEEQVEAAIAEYENKGIIRGYKPLLDYNKIDTQYVEAVIELKVTPKRDFGFEEIAHKISSYPEVDSVFLMSGGYDLHVQEKPLKILHFSSPSVLPFWMVFFQLPHTSCFPIIKTAVL